MGVREVVGRALRAQVHASDFMTLSTTKQGRDVIRAAGEFIAEQGGRAHGATPYVPIPGFTSNPLMYSAKRFFLNEVGIPTVVPWTELSSTGRITSDARQAIKAGVALMREEGANGFVLGGYSRGAMGAEVVRTEHPEVYQNLVRAFISEDGALSATAVEDPSVALKVTRWMFDATLGGRELKHHPEIIEAALESRVSGLTAKHAADPDFRAIAFQAADAQSLLPREVTALPEIPGVTRNVVVNGTGGHEIGLGYDIDFDRQLAKELLALPTNRNVTFS